MLISIQNIFSFSIILWQASVRLFIIWEIPHARLEIWGCLDVSPGYHVNLSVAGGIADLAFHSALKKVHIGFVYEIIKEHI